jgi:hypothetical protein
VNLLERPAHEIRHCCVLSNFETMRPVCCPGKDAGQCRTVADISYHVTKVIISRTGTSPLHDEHAHK